jgi:monofunctional glycosyltransferase
VKTFLVAACALLATLVVLAFGSYWAVRAALAPLPGEWSTTLDAGPFEIEAGVPSLVRLATSPWAGPWLAGRRFPTKHGVVALGWDSSQGALRVRCAPCTVQQLTLPELNATVERHAESLSGEVWAGRVRARWQGELARDRLQLKLAVPATPLADGYALFATQVPEVQQAQIAGTFSLDATVTLPGGTMTVVPRIEGFEVSGLGTQALAGARSSCGKRPIRLTAGDSLPRAVIAAEDQRFFDHPGYDLVEVAASMARNEKAGRIERGASTITQQVAKLLITGSDRTPARKLRELLYAVEMERTLGKARILRLYLESAPWGSGGLCGAEAAAWHHFGVRAHELTPEQAAVLASMLHNPALEVSVERVAWIRRHARELPRRSREGGNPGR